jgi:predicted phosphoribosyltransferase
MHGTAEAQQRMIFARSFGMESLFVDRTDAGRQLAEIVAGEIGVEENPIVLALPRGGVPVGYEVARRLDAPLDVFVVRKLGAPGQRELAIGAIASGDVRILNQDIVDALRIPSAWINEVTEEERQELVRREDAYRDGRPLHDVAGRTAILVDDGLATGASMRAAIVALRALSPRRVVVAVPVAARETCADVRRDADDVICAATPEPFISVGGWYEDFSQTSDEEVHELLARAAEEHPEHPRGGQ